MRTELGSWRKAWRRVGKAEVDADMVEEKLEEEEARRRRRGEEEEEEEEGEE